MNDITRSTLFARLLPTLPEGRIREVCIGLYWTAVLAEVEGNIRCGMAATLRDETPHFEGEPSVSRAGHLTELTGCQLAEYVYSFHFPEVSIGLATVNALLPPRPDLWVDVHSKEVLARLGAGRTVVMVGHFPFVSELRPRVGRLFVLEQHPNDEFDLPAECAPEIIPQADVLAVTAMTLLNRTFDEVMALRQPNVPLIIIGPSTPLTPLLFEIGATILSGAVVEQPGPVLRAIREGANFHQVRQVGVRLVSMTSTKV
ncbi:MAG: DUF364 domain-containing protein [Anaerolineales bacterium]|nr:DUF364 domain-containing protein [Anaerolineales bacterium]